jgi:hypothetical protein
MKSYTLDGYVKILIMPSNSTRINNYENSYTGLSEME